MEDKQNYLTRAIKQLRVQRSRFCTADGAPRPFMKKLGMHLACLFLDIVIVLTMIPLALSTSGTETFQRTARFVPEEGFLDSYAGHLRYYRASIGTALMAVLLIALQVISIAGLSLLTLFGNPQPTKAAGEHMIGFWSGEAAPAGWTCVSCVDGDPFYQKFPRGANVYGGTGGSDTNTHAVTWVSSSSSGRSALKDGVMGSYIAGANHTHSTLGATSMDAATSLPQYQNLKVIQADTVGTPSTIPSGFIGVFDVASLPSGWTRYAAQDTLFVRGENDAIGTGGAATHTHTNVTITTGSPSVLAGTAPNESPIGNPPTATHTHTGSGTTASGDHTPLYRDVILAFANSDTTVPDGLIAMWDASPEGYWTPLSDIGGVFENRFLRGAASYGGVGGAGTHIHANLGIVTGVESANTPQAAGLSTFYSPSSHTHTITVSFGSANNLPPYIDVIIAKYTAPTTISGVAYTDEGITPLDGTAVNKTVNLRVNGAGAYTDEITDATGAWSIDTTGLVSGDIVTVYLDGEAEQATTVFVSDATAQTNVDLYQNRVIVRADTGSISNANMATGDDTDADVLYAVATNNLTVDNDIELHVWTGDSYAPTGTVATQGTGSLHLDDDATATLDTATNAIAGDIVADTGITLTVNADTTVAGGDITTAGTATVTHTSGTPTITVSGTGSIGGGSNAITAYNLTLSGTPTLASDLSIKNALVLPASVTAGSTTVTMTGTSGTITGGGATLANLTINPATAGTVTLQTSDLTISGTLVVAADDTLSLAADRTLTHSGSTLTLTGTISGAGRLTYTSATAFPTTGTMSSVLRFDVTNNNQTMSVRTYGGDVEVVNTSDTNARTVTMGNSTITIFGSLTIAANGSQDVTLDADFNDAYPYIEEDFDFTGTGAGSERVLSGGQTWTMAGNVDLTGGTYVTSAATSFSMIGTGKTLTTAGNTLRNVSIYGSITFADPLTMDGNLYIGDTLDAAGQPMTVGGSWDNQGIFTPGGNTVTFNSSGVGKTIVAGASSFNNLEFNNVAGGWTIQTNDMTVGGNLTLTAATSLTLQSGRTLTVTGNFTNSAPGATTWAGTTLYLNGSGGLQTINTKGNGDIYATVRIGASEDVAMWHASASTVIADSGGCLLSQDDAGIDGRLNIYGTCNSRTNEYWSYTKDFDGTDLSGGSERKADVRFASGASFTVDNGDTLQILGQSSAANRTAITRQSTGNYGMTVDGTLSAQYYDFDYLNASGLNITSGATVSALAYGGFDNNASGASSAYITVTGITATATFTNLTFDDNADGTDGNVVYNVNADGSGIAWTFLAAGGDAAGERKDREVNGAVISWGTLLVIVNDGPSGDAEYTNSDTTLSGNWVVSNDTGIDHYEYALGTSAGASDTKAFTDVGLSNNVTTDSFMLSDGTTYYVTIRVYNALDAIIDEQSSNGVTVDTEAATFADITASTTETGATITWTSSEETSTQVQYGLTNAYGSETTEDAAFVTSHSASITGLASGETYHYRVSGSDQAGNAALSSDSIFTTSEEEATVITDTSATVLSPTSVRITWTTNHAADSKVRYGLTTAYGQEVYDAELVTSHTVTLTDLTPGVQYHYEVLSVGNTSTNDADATFTTDTENVDMDLTVPNTIELNGSEAHDGAQFVAVTVLKSRTLTISGEAEPDALVMLRIASPAEYTTTTPSDRDGNWSVEIAIADTTLDIGAHTIYAKVSKDGVMSDEIKIGEFSLTSAAYLPSPTILTPNDGERNIDGRPVITGLARSGNTVHLYVDGERIATVRATQHNSGTGSFGHRITSALAPGTHTLSAVAIDGDSASRNSPEKTFTVELPFIGITFLDAHIVSASPEPSIAFEGIGAGGSRVDFYLNDEYLDRIGLLNGHDSVEHFTYKLYANNLVPKEYTLYAIAYDEHGKPSRKSNVVSFTKSSDVAASILVTSLGSASVPPQPSTPQPVQLPEAIGTGPGGTYTVQGGDSLWKIAQDQLGDGSRYAELVALNQNAHPELLVNPGSISIDWILRLP